MDIQSPQINATFSSNVLLKGKELLKNPKVCKIKSVTANTIDAEIDKQFKVKIEFDYGNRNAYFTDYSIDAKKLSTRCSCEKTKSCEHAVAGIVYYLKHKEKYDQNYGLLDWLSQLNSNGDSNVTPIKGKKVKANNIKPFKLLYIFLVKEHQLYIKLKLARPLKSGGYGTDKTFNPDKDTHTQALTDEDEKILFYLDWDEDISLDIYPIDTPVKEELVKQILKTNRAFYLSKDNLPLQLGDALAANPIWQMDEKGNQYLSANLPNDHAICFKISKLWYLKENIFGEISLNIETSILSKLLSAPPIPIAKMDEVISHLKPLNVNLPKPKTSKDVIEKEIQPIPCLHLLNVDAMMIDPEVKRSKRNYFYYDYPTIDKVITVGELKFKYAQANVNYENPTFRLYEKTKDSISIINRDLAFESQQINYLSRSLKLKQLNKMTDFEDYDEVYENAYYLGDDDQNQLVEETIEKLKEKGWLITVDEDYTLETLEDEELEWYSELGESSYDWFSLNLGVVIEGEKINILPLIVEYLKSNTIESINDLSDDSSIALPLKDGRCIMLIAKRLKSILSVLAELFEEKPLNEAGLLELNELHASQLETLEEKINITQFSWLGSKKVRELGKKLQSFEGIKEVQIPKSFKATLRPYQQQGVNWLRFLNEYGLNGILADDMGLGKTIQTLANLAIEYDHNQVMKPSLIIAPTSLLVNWHNEAKQFAPNLRTLVLHGDKRHDYFDQINDHDVVITSYPLVFRDAKILKVKAFNYIILDEAQVIKNHNAKITKIIYDLESDHRLCLSGTPLENHLGELWSQFRFLAPGFLGTSKRFKTLYRTPIEKHHNLERRQILGNRVKPFMLRRTKAEVAIDLPPKTEIIKTVSLEDAQRDLYETIRIAMDKKVREVIAKQGLQKSHIIVLDALLKLRQTCCDPRLLKIDSATKAHGHSAKLSMLMDLLPSMVEEGRRILLFSQFTSMLELIEEELKTHKINFVKLTGSTKDRASVINQFQQGDIPVFLISLKSGGVGLNLTAADTIIHYDPWWNPAVEDQATDRAHRIGQDKPVFVYKLISEGTVEETILKMQSNKRAIVDGLLSDSRTPKGLNLEDLNYLFKPLEVTETEETLETV